MAKSTKWETDRAARMAVGRGTSGPNENWYQLLLDTAKQNMPDGTKAEAIYSYVNGLLVSHGVTITPDQKAPGGLSLSGYTDEVHSVVAKIITGQTINEQRAEVGLPPATEAITEETVALMTDAERLTLAAKFAVESTTPDQLCQQALMDWASHNGLGRTSINDLWIEAMRMTDTPQGTIGVDVVATYYDLLCKLLFDRSTSFVDPGFTPVGTIYEYADDAAPAVDFEVDESDPLLAAAAEVGGEPEEESPKTTTDVATTAGATAAPATTAQASVEAAPDACTEDHEAGGPCFVCDWTGEPAANELFEAQAAEKEREKERRQQLDIKEAAPIYEARNALIDATTGEILNPDECLMVARMMPLRPLDTFAIVPGDDDAARWYIELVRTIQNRIEETLSQAHLRCGVMLRALAGLDYKYGFQIAQWAAAKLPTFSRGERKGEYRQKSHREDEGAVFFRKTGGAKIVSYAELQQFVDSLPPEKLEYYGVEIKRKWKADHIKRLAEKGEHIPGILVEPIHELGTCTIGGERQWSFTGVKQRASKKLKALVLHGESEDGDDDAA